MLGGVERSLTPGTAILLVGIAVTAILNARFAFPARLLVGLRRYQVAGDLSPAQKPRGKKVKSKKKDEEETSDVDNLLLIPTTFKETWGLRFYNLYDGLVALAELSLLVSVLSVAYGWFFQDYPPNVGLALGALCIVASLAALVRTELVARSTRTSDKIMCVIYGAGALVAAMMTQVKDPLWAPTQRQGLAVQPLNDLVRAWGGRVRAPPEITLAGLRWVLAGGSGALASILLIPTLRFASALCLQRRVPAWASDYIPDSHWLRTRLHIQFIAPLVASMLWGSMRADVLFRVPPSHARLIQAAALILAALASLANVSLLVQRYLDTGLLAWYSLRVPVEGGLTDAGLRRELVRRKVSLTGLLAGRAAVQAVAPAVLLLGMGLVQLHNGLHPGLSRAADVNGLLDVMLGFLAWWVGASTFLFGATHIWVIDTPGV